MKERLYRFRSFWIFPLIAAGLLYFTFPNQVPAPRVFARFVIGVLAWTLLEYGLHRFVFHIQVPLRNPKLRDIVNASHLAHHASPRDPERLLVKTMYGLTISVLLFGAIYAIARDAFSTSVVLTGIWAGFLYYEAVHYRVHFSLSGFGLVAWQRRKHFHHHFTNNKQWFGVTTPLWDYVFGTTGGAIKSK